MEVQQWMWQIKTGDGNMGTSTISCGAGSYLHAKGRVRAEMLEVCTHEDQWVWDETNDDVVLWIDEGCDPDGDGNYPRALNGTAFFVVEAVRGVEVGNLEVTRPQTEIDMLRESFPDTMEEVDTDEVF